MSGVEVQRDLLPYKVVPYDFGAANVVDRNTGDDLGYVLSAWRGWEAFLSSAPGVALVFDTVPTDPRLVDILGPTRDITVTKYRRDAAAKVWTVSQSDGSAS